ncbi:MAG: hypothetical protein JSR15_04205 [Proteobacteria bacterium]|nr:hypothetical protein [Pseudomonadota bacterium]
MGKPGDALVLLGFVFVVMGITIVQERRTERRLFSFAPLHGKDPAVSLVADSCCVIWLEILKHLSRTRLVAR